MVRQIVYFHGQPGSADELSLLDGPLREDAALFVPNRSGRRGAPGDWLEDVTAQVKVRFPKGPLQLIGFSLGGYVALEVALRLQDERALELDLISAAAPLSEGRFLRHMAGGLVFRLARDWPWLFGQMTRLQGSMVKSRPGAMFAQVFASAAGEDKVLAADPDFRDTLIGIMRHSLFQDAVGYRREILSYVNQAPERLSGLTAPVRLWQGAEDNWTPPGMAEALARRLPRAELIPLMAGLSHYSTLRAALPRILSSKP
jgi:pimeloyl-ACP methyl ester carboxylesterase